MQEGLCSVRARWVDAPRQVGLNRTVPEASHVSSGLPTAAVSSSGRAFLCSNQI